MTFAGLLIAWSTIGGTSGDGRKISTASNGMRTASRDGYAFSPRISVAVGFTGMMRYPAICMYFGTRCASFAGSFEQPTTAIVLISVRMRLTSLSSIGIAMRSRRARRLSLPGKHAVNRLSDARREAQRVHDFRREPMDFGVLFVRDARLAIPSGNEEEVVTKRLLRGRVDIFVDAEEPGVRYADAELLLELAGQRRRRLLTARDDRRTRPTS